MRKFLKPGTVLGVIAAVLALSGTAIAGSLITSTDIKDGTIKARDIKKAAITSDRLADDVRAELAKAGQPGPQGVKGESGVRGEKGAQGDKGETGARGNTGAKGDTGAQGPKGDDGADGTQGPKGDDGADGTQGPAGPQGPAGRDALTYVTELDGSQLWIRREATCGGEQEPAGKVTLDGHLVLGRFADGNAFSGARLMAVPAGLRLRDIQALSFAERATGGIDGYNAAYMRVFTKDGAGATHGVIYSPSTQAGGPGTTKEWRRHNIRRGSVRYDDDAGNSPDVTWEQMIAAHGDDTIAELRVQAGCAGGYSDGSTAYVDDVLLIAAGHVLRYDFE